ncbi:MAG: hypothetical protein LBF28_03505 [Rickettsiales bacterium]|jgi:hypothetical protein|nr:hypothetical protein [Rickettsiales bacterium]
MTKTVKIIKDPTYLITGILQFDFTQPIGRKLPAKQMSDKIWSSTSPQARFSAQVMRQKKR